MNLHMLGAKRIPVLGMQLWDPAWGPEPTSAADATPPAGLTPHQQEVWQAWKSGKMNQENVKGDPSALDSTSWADFLPNLAEFVSVKVPTWVKVGVVGLGVAGLGFAGWRILK